MKLHIDWAKFVKGLLVAAPGIIKEVETIHSTKDTTSKTDLAAGALVAANEVARSVDPNDRETIDQMTGLAGGIVDAFKTDPKTLGVAPTPAKK